MLPTLVRSKNRSEEAKSLWGLLIGSAQNNAEKKFADLPSGIVETFYSHLLCSRTRGTINPFLLEYKPFQISWFEIRNVDKGDKVEPSTWKTGVLYDSHGQRIQETAFTVGYYPRNPDWWNSVNFLTYENFSMEDLVKKGYCFWTILLLTPSSLGFIVEDPHYRPSFLLDMIECGLRRCADSWERIGTYFSSILDDQPIVDPSEHDKLLFDDDTFSRSRRYFWAVDSLEVFRTQILDTIQEWDNFWDAREMGIRMFENAHKLRCEYMTSEGDEQSPVDGSVEKSLQKVLVQEKRLEEQDAQFEAFFKKTLALREGVRHTNLSGISKTWY
jgi:hypothetical protein